ncbi:MAG: 4Fe-4S binding protein [Proteobacteria bacterium]|nr:4Fe-4S binding protein [Pseudomonadota bacterium]MBU1059390.1 4Fe-4S binding protein [Pseudomonadota bacterium]
MTNNDKNTNAEKEPPASTPKSAKKKRKLYTVTFFHNWCKSCGLCSAFCIKKIILKDETGRPYIEDMDSCTGCRFCEIHCPDFAITIKNRHPVRRSTDDNG